MLSYGTDQGQCGDDKMIDFSFDHQYARSSVLVEGGTVEVEHHRAQAEIAVQCLNIVAHFDHNICGVDVQLIIADVFFVYV